MCVRVRESERRNRKGRSTNASTNQREKGDRWTREKEKKTRTATAKRGRERERETSHEVLEGGGHADGTGHPRQLEQRAMNVTSSRNVRSPQGAARVAGQQPLPQTQHLIHKLLVSTTEQKSDDNSDPVSFGCRNLLVLESHGVFP